MEKVRYPDLLPWEFRERLAAKPVAYLPLGTLAWHGEHLPLGSDAIQSEVLQGWIMPIAPTRTGNWTGVAFRPRPY